MVFFKEIDSGKMFFGILDFAIEISFWKTRFIDEMKTKTYLSVYRHYKILGFT